MRNNNLISEYENGRRHCPLKYFVLFSGIDLPDTILGIQYANEKLSEVYHYIQIKGKIRVLEDKLSINEP